MQNHKYPNLSYDYCQQQIRNVPTFTESCDIDYR